MYLYNIKAKPCLVTSIKMRDCLLHVLKFKNGKQSSVLNVISLEFTASYLHVLGYAHTEYLCKQNHHSIAD